MFVLCDAMLCHVMRDELCNAIHMHSGDWGGFAPSVTHASVARRMRGEGEEGDQRG